jgi:hypothetical protein
LKNTDDLNFEDVGFIIPEDELKKYKVLKPATRK